MFVKCDMENYCFFSICTSATFESLTFGSTIVGTTVSFSDKVVLPFG